MSISFYLKGEIMAKDILINLDDLALYHEENKKLTKAELNNISVPTKISQLENDGNFAEFDASGNLNVPERVKANTAEFSDGIYSSGGIYEDNQYGGNATVTTEEELVAITGNGYMPDGLLVKLLSQNMGGYSFYNNPYVVYEVSTSAPLTIDDEYVLSDSDTGYTYVGEYTEVYYSEIIEGDFKRRAGADTVSPFSGGGSGNSTVSLQVVLSGTASTSKDSVSVSGAVSGTVTFIIDLSNNTVTQDGSFKVVAKGTADSDGSSRSGSKTLTATATIV